MLDSSTHKELAQRISFSHADEKRFLIRMEKPAETAHPIHELLRRRWSPRAFAARPVEPGKLRSLLEAARWAPSSYNEQPWSFIVATKDDPAEYERLLSCLVEFNQGWAKAAPVLFISVASLRFSRNQKENRHAMHDVGLATENLVIQATALGLFAHGMAGFDVAKTREVYGIPDSHLPAAAWALGYPGEPEMLGTELHERELEPRERKPLDQFVFSGKWNQKSALV
jgi:nitroreductase